jgi:hypothetical protein
MADNVGYTPGVGASVAADEISGHLYQRIKPTYGTDGQATDVSVENPLPVFDDRVENLISLLERLVKISESNQVVDSAQRQRITLDAITSGVSLPTVAAVTTVTTVTTVNTVAAVTNMVSNAGMDREQYINIAKQTYANSIRNRLNIV